MRKTYCSIAFILFILSFLPVKAFAGSAAGGEIFYEWVSDSTYRFYFKYYRDCTGSPEPLTQPLCFYNTCNNTSFSVNMGQYLSIAAPLVNSCGYKTQCDSPSSTIAGYATTWYYNTVTMPTRCSEWKIFTYIGTRVNSVNLQNATLTDMYVEATMNNLLNYNDNSPYFTNSAIIYSCINNAYIYNAGAVDPDNDSLVTEVIQPRTGVTSCSNTPINAAFASGTPPYSIPANPIQTNYAFSIVQATGKIEMIPKIAGVSTMCIKVKQYRSGVLIGSIMRELPVNVMTCNTPQVTAKIGCENGIAFSGMLNGYACVTLPFSFCMDIVSADPNARYILTDNHTAAMPGSNVVTTGQNSDSIRMNFSWAPALNDGGSKQLELTLTDNTCYYPGVPNSQTIHLPIYVNRATKITIDDTVLCSSQPIILSVVNGGYFTWEILNAVDTTSFTGATFSDTPVISTRYIVTSNYTDYCPLHTDTVDVYVVPTKKPIVSINVVPDTVIGTGQTVTFGIANSDCNNPVYSWRVNGVDVPGADSSTWEVNTLNDMDIVQCKMVCNDTCANDTVSNGITIHVTNSVYDVSGISNIKLYPNPNNGFFILKGYAGKAESMKLSIVNAIGQVLYFDSYEIQAGTFSKDINMQHLPDGIYILKLEQKGRTEVKQFRVNH